MEAIIDTSVIIEIAKDNVNVIEQLSRVEVLHHYYNQL